KRIASSEVKALRVWEVVSGKELLTIRRPDENVGAVTFTPDSARLIGSVGNNLMIWDASDGRLLTILKGHPASVDHVAVSRDGRRIISGGGGGRGPGSTADPCAVRIWDADSGQELLSLSGHKEGISGLAISPDGMRIVTCSAIEKTLRL